MMIFNSSCEMRISLKSLISFESHFSGAYKLDYVNLLPLPGYDETFYGKCYCYFKLYSEGFVFIKELL